jgi:hypothetical protein
MGWEGSIDLVELIFGGHTNEGLTSTILNWKSDGLIIKGLEGRPIDSLEGGVKPLLINNSTIST